MIKFITTRWYHMYYGLLELMGLDSCEECNQWFRSFEMCDYNMCEACYTHHYCECGVRLEDSYGSPGDGLCRRCD